MDLKPSMWVSVKVFCKGLHVQLAAKLLCLKSFMVYGICFLQGITALADCQRLNHKSIK